MASSSGKGVAIFGAGRIGTIHFQNCYLQPDVRIEWIVEEYTDRAYQLINKYKCQNTVKVASLTEVEKVLSDDRVDFIMVCTPSSTHENIVNAALKAGKAVFCEKPLSLSVESCRQCYIHAHQKGLLLYCAFNRRYDPSMRKIHTQVRSGQVGQIRSIRYVSRDPVVMSNMDYIRTSGGILVDSAIHNIDMVCWLSGEAPCSVYATGHAMDPAFAQCNDVDTIIVMLNFPSGVKGVIEVNRNAHINHDQRLEVFCEKGLLLMNNIGATNTVLVDPEGATADPFYNSGVYRYADSYRLELDHFMEAFQGTCELEVTGASTMLANEVVAAAQASLKTGQVVSFNQQQLGF